MYVISGATGKVGGAAARALLDAGLPVRVVVRDKAKGRDWAARGCEIAVADLGDEAVLANAFTGAEAVFAMLPPVFDPSAGFPEAKAMIAVLRRALETAAPKRVVALSTIGAESDRPNLLSQLGLLEEALGALPMPVAFLRPAWFIDNAAWDVASARETGVIRSYLQPLDRAIPMVAAEDVGRTIAALLQEAWAARRVVELEAARRISPDDLAAALAKALGRSVRAEAVPRGDWEAIFRSEGMANPLPRMQMIDGFNAGWIDFPDRGASALRGRTSLDEAVAALVGG